MTNFFSLLKVQLLSLFGLNKILHGDKTKKLKGVGGLVVMALLFGCLIGGIGCIYSQMFATMLAQTNQIHLLIPLMIAMSAIISLIFSIYEINATLFGFKDYDMLMSMPLKPQTIVGAKYAFIYLGDLILSLLVVIPSIIVYASYTGGIVVGEVLATLLFVVVSPLLPIAISTIVGTVIAIISSFFKKTAVIQTILTILIFVAFLAFNVLSGMDMEENAGLPFFGSLNSIYFIMPWLVNGQSDFLYGLLYVAVNVLPAILIFTLLCVYYKKLNTVITAKRTSGAYKVTTYSSSSVKKALFVKEIRRLFSCSIYAVNCIFGAIMSVLLSVGIVIAYHYLKSLDPSIVVAIEALMVFLPVIYCFSFMMAPTTACSLSLEGNKLWLLKTAPLSFKEIMNAKLSVNNLLNVLPAFVSSLVVFIFCGMEFFTGVLLVVCAVAIAFTSGTLGLLFNLRFPKYDWKSETEAAKQGLPVFLMVMTSMGLTALLSLFIYFVELPMLAIFGIIASFFVACAVVTYILLIKQGEKLFHKYSK